MSGWTGRDVHFDLRMHGCKGTKEVHEKCAGEVMLETDLSTGTRKRARSHTSCPLSCRPSHSNGSQVVYIVE